jgi:hypothetical protein
MKGRGKKNGIYFLRKRDLSLTFFFHHKDTMIHVSLHILSLEWRVRDRVEHSL